VGKLVNESLDEYINEYGKKAPPPEIRYWENNDLLKKQKIAIKAGLSSDIADKKWDDLEVDERARLLTYWSKNKRGRYAKWSYDDRDTKVASFSGGWEKDTWRGPNPSNK
jgi:hypothetical protein